MIGGTPLTVEMMADAFGYFWNAALAHQHPTVEANMVEGFNAVSMRLQELASEAKEKRMKILLGVLSDPKEGMRIGHDVGQWILATGFGDSYEELVRHEKWPEFIKLVAEYNEGDDNG